MQNWDTHKRIVLSKSDKSFKASIDEPILELVDGINASRDFFTTSSCSGRIMLIREGDFEKRKNGASFTFVSHDIISPEKYPSLLGMCKDVEGNIFLKLEPLILHIEARTLEFGIKLLQRLKRESEFKHTCIVSAASDKFIVCVKAMVKLEIPIVYNSELIIDHQLLHRYLNIANERMTENFAAITKLTQLVSNGLLDQLTCSSDKLVQTHCPLPVLVPISNQDVTSTMSSSQKEVHPFSGYTVSDDLKSVTNSIGVSFGTIPSLSHGRPSVSRDQQLCVVHPSVLLVVSNGELWSLVGFEKRRSQKFQWQKHLNDVVSVCFIGPNLVEILRKDSSRNSFRIDM